MNDEDMVGVECVLCHEEAFQLQPREVTHIVPCCPRCVRKVDAEKAEREMEQAARGMGKAERRLYLQEQSFIWANSLHGESVILSWDESDGYGNVLKAVNTVSGRALRVANASGGWGCVKVIINPDEHWRIQEVRDWRYEGFGREMHKVPYMRPEIDGQKYGLYLNKQNGGYFVYITWGNRGQVMVSPVAVES